MTDGGRAEMRRSRMPLAAAAVLALSFAAAARADDEPDVAPTAGEPLVAYTAEVAFNSQYLWRGLANTRGAVMQPYVDVSSYGATAWAWSNLVLEHEPNEGRFTEVDLGLSYGYPWEWVELTGQVQFWVYPYDGYGPSTGQLDVKVSVPLDPFAIWTVQTVDILGYAGAWYGELGADFAHEFDDGPTVEASAFVGWASDRFNDGYLGVDRTAWNVLGSGFAVTWPFSVLYVRAHAECTYLLDADLRAAVDEPFLVVGGIAIGTAGPP
jgi:hypothetical protein